MPTNPTPGPDPFLCRNSVNIAGEIGAAASATSTAYRALHVVIHGLAGQESEGPASLLADFRDDLDTATAELGRLFDQVDWWWIADHPPALVPEATSVVEALLRSALYMLACLKAPEVEDTVSCCKLAEKLISITAAENRIEARQLPAALRCEVATMSRRPPPDLATREAFEHVSGTWSGLTSESSRASKLVMSSLGRSWAERSQSNRAAAIKRGWDPPLQPPLVTPLAELKRRPGRPPNPPELVDFVAKLRHEQPEMTWPEVAQLTNEKKVAGRTDHTAESLRKEWEKSLKKACAEKPQRKEGTA